MSLRQAGQFLEDSEKRSSLKKVGAALGGAFITSLAGCSTGSTNTSTATETVYDERTDGTPTVTETDEETNTATPSGIETPSETEESTPTPEEEETPEQVTGKQVYKESVIDKKFDLESSPFIETTAEIYDKFNDESLDTLQKELWQHEDLTLDKDLKNASTMREKMEAYFVNSSRLVGDRVAGAQLFQYFAHQDQEIQEQLGINLDLPDITYENTRIDPRTLYDGGLGAGVTALFKDENGEWQNDLAIPQFEGTDKGDYKGPAHETDFFDSDTKLTLSWLSYSTIKRSIEDRGGKDEVPEEGWDRIDRGNDDIIYGSKAGEADVVYSETGYEFIEDILTDVSEKTKAYLDKINEKREEVDNGQYLGIHAEEGNLILKSLPESVAEKAEKLQWDPS